MPYPRQYFIPIWQTAPFIRLLIPFIAGIITSNYTHHPWQVWLTVLGTSIVCTIFFAFRAIRQPILFGVSLQLLLFTMGACLFKLNHTREHPQYLGHYYTPGTLLAATIETVPIEKPKSYKAEASVAIWDSLQQHWLPTKGNIIIYFSKDSIQPPPPLGSQLSFLKPLQPIRNSGNPGAFDYIEFSARNQLFFMVYLTQKDYLVSPEKQTFYLKKYTHTTQAWLLKNLRTYIPDKKSLGVAEALLTGYREDMDKELAVEYSSTGVAHIIAISGLHLGMIQTGLLFLLSWLLKLKNGRQLRAILVIAILWAFALMTGGSPSVLRSALMFSMILMGEVIGKKNNSYNGLAASAFLLLIFNPYLVWNVGFQLSYSAVLSILIFSGPISRWVQSSSKIINYGWQLVAVTLSAQILTLPFVVYYFNQFPVYFLLANLVAVPLTGIILFVLIVLAMGIWWWPWLAIIIGKIASALIGFMNEFIGFVHRLPMSKVEEIYFPLHIALLAMIFIVFAAGWLLRRSGAMAVAAMVTLSILVILRVQEHTLQIQQQKMIVYHVNNQTAIDFIKGKESWFLGDSVCNAPGMIRKMNIQPSRTIHQVKNTGLIDADTSGFQELMWGNLRLLLLQKPIDYRKSDTVTTDILLIAANLRANPYRILDKIHCRQIVADGKLPYYRIDQWKIAADSLHLPFHSVAEQGAFVFNIK